MMTCSRSILLCLVVYIVVTCEVGIRTVSAVTTPSTNGTTHVMTTHSPTTPPATATTSVPLTTQAPKGTTTEAGQTTGMTPGDQTMTPGNQTFTTAVAGNSTENTTGSTAGPTTAVPLPDTPRFQVNNSDGEPCMLLNFNATLTVKYPTKSMGIQTARIPIMNSNYTEGSCNNGTLRNFTLYYPSNNTYCASLTLSFNMTSNTTYYNREGLYLRYIEPCFMSDATQFDTPTGGHFPSPSYKGTVGKSFRCQSISQVSKKLNLTLVLDDILIQPFAQSSVDKGSYGEIETCSKALPTTPVPSTPKPHPPTKPSPSNAGKIVGIVIGVVAVVGTIVAIAVYVVRKRRYKAVTYGNLLEDPPRAI
ncbi:uncharacterized protein LOC119724184 [Patiria miniata]|uniref:Lysosome-associated membrane glycoprotein 5 n=1 Tax=Patiria miniata TaxID=46514 RepID=A0A913ZJ26_PATMI|nr:uncharacterized protein LOC119724184 [Patiria miniata]